MLAAVRVFHSWTCSILPRFRIGIVHFVPGLQIRHFAYHCNANKRLWNVKLSLGNISIQQSKYGAFKVYAYAIILAIEATLETSFNTLTLSSHQHNHSQAGGFGICAT